MGMNSKYLSISIIVFLVTMALIGGCTSQTPQSPGVQVSAPFWPWDWGNYMGTMMGSSPGAAKIQLQQDPSLAAACHMEYWENTTRSGYSYDGYGIHTTNMTDLNYVCYFRDGHVEVLKIESYENYSDAMLSVSLYYRGYNGVVYHVKGDSP
jgi:hypothetical protein